MDSSSNDNKDTFYHTSNTTADHITTAIINGRPADDDDDEEDFTINSSATSVMGEVPFLDEELSSTITLVGDVAGKVVFIVVSFF